MTFCFYCVWSSRGRLMLLHTGSESRAILTILNTILTELSNCSQKLTRQCVLLWKKSKLSGDLRPSLCKQTFKPSLIDRVLTPVSQRKLTRYESTSILRSFSAELEAMSRNGIDTSNYDTKYSRSYSNYHGISHKRKFFIKLNER